MTRSRGNHLSNAEREALHADIRAGVPRQDLMVRYNIVSRTLDAHQASVANGEIAPLQICLVDRCYDPKAVPSKFCERHQCMVNTVPGDRARLMAGRA